MEFPQFEYGAIDIHSHFNHGAKGESTDPAIDALHKNGLGFLTEESAKMGIRKTAYSTYSSVLSSDYVAGENEYLHDLVSRTEGIYQWVVIHPLFPETFRQAERMLDHKKVLGLKIHSPMHGYDILERGDEIFSFANEMGAFLLMHPHKTERMTELADKYPNMKLIIAHIGSQAHIDAVLGAKHGNIYVDTSGYRSSFNYIIEHAVKAIGSEKIFFGTDTYSPIFQYARVALADIPKEDKENILYKNAMKHFPKCFG